MSPCSAKIGFETFASYNARVEAGGIKSTSLELQISSIIDRIGFVVKPFELYSEFDAANVVHSQAIVDKFRLDFALIGAKIAIEAEGQYWHGHKSKLSMSQVTAKLHDTRKYAVLEQLGWRIIILKEGYDQNAQINHIERCFLNYLEV